MFKFLEERINKLFENLESGYLNKPSSKTLTQWQDWNVKAKKEKPIVYFLIEEYLFDMSVIIGDKILNSFYSIRSKYFKQRHVVKIDIQRFVTNQNSYQKYNLDDYHYSDPSWTMLYVNFQILVNYVEYEAYIVDWDYDKQHRKVWKEISELYIWWTEIRFQDLNDNKFLLSSDFGLTRKQMLSFRSELTGEKEPIEKNEEIIKRYKKYQDYQDNYHKTLFELEKHDQVMLMRLTKIREQLWS